MRYKQFGQYIVEPRKMQITIYRHGRLGLGWRTSQWKHPRKLPGGLPTQEAGAQHGADRRTPEGSDPAFSAAVGADTQVGPYGGGKRGGCAQTT